jgi:hypothetical protein
MHTRQRKGPFALLLVLAVLFGACVTQRPGSGSLHRWWAGLGPVLPHDTFPADCKLCHMGVKWNTLKDDFEFDHTAKTGVPLDGAHAQARCLRCHNDRGPVAVFESQGCVGCHEDVHKGELGRTCTKCHQEQTWDPIGQFEMHNHGRFPLTGAHAAVSCHRCHPGARVGDFIPADNECATCHRDDVANANNPPHIALGWVDNCDRCHLPTRWNQATIR